MFRVPPRWVVERDIYSKVSRTRSLLTHMSDYELLRAVMRSRDALQDTANKAQARLDEMKQGFKALLKEQEAIVEAAEKMHSE